MYIYLQRFYSEEAQRFEDTARDTVDGVMEILKSDYENAYFVTGVWLILC